MQPYCCPVCQGRGTKPYSFYSPPTPGTSFGAISCDVMCRSCFGRGIVWRGDGDTEGQPATIMPPAPITYGGGATTVTLNSGPYPLTPLIPINHPACSVESPTITKEREERRSSIDPAYLHGGY